MRCHIPACREFQLWLTLVTSISLFQLFKYFWSFFEYFFDNFSILSKEGVTRGKWVDIFYDTLIWRTHHPNLHPSSSYHNFYSNNPNIYGAIYNTHLHIEDLMTPIHNVGKLVSNFPYIFNIPIVIIET